jgi:hypothetical protein
MFTWFFSLFQKKETTVVTEAKPADTVAEAKPAEAVVEAKPAETVVETKSAEVVPEVTTQVTPAETVVETPVVAGPVVETVETAQFSGVETAVGKVDYPAAVLFDPPADKPKKARKPRAKKV